MLSEALAVDGSSPVTSARQTDDHDDDARDYGADWQQFGHGFVECRPDFHLEEDALPLLVLRKRACHRLRHAFR